MGWLVMYVAVFMLMTTAMMNYQVEQRDEADIDQAGATASHLFLWHKAAMAACQTAGYCPASGRVDPVLVRSSMGSVQGYRGAQYQFSGLTNAAVFAGNKFVSLVDLEDRLIVTYYNNPLPMNQYNGRVVAQMSAGQNYSAMMGFYDAANHRIDRVRALADDNPLVLRATIPSSIGGETVPDNAPTIVTRF